MNEKLLRMAADMLIPVGERDGMIASLVEGAQAAKDMHTQLTIMSEQIIVLTNRINALNIAVLIPHTQTANTIEDAAQVAEEVAAEVAADVAMQTVIEIGGEPVNLDEGLSDTRTEKGAA